MIRDNALGSGTLRSDQLCPLLQSEPYSPIGAFQLPLTPLLPLDTTYDETKSKEVEVRFLPPVVQGTCRHHRPVVLPRCGEQAAVTCWCIPCPLSSSGVASRQRSPAGASLAPCPPQVWRAGSGHLLVHPLPLVLLRCGEPAAVTCWCIPCPLSSSGVASRQRSPAGASSH